MGVVYRARHLALKRTVALKMILAGGQAGAAERARFKAEAEAVARLQHPGIVQVHEVGEHAGHPFCALEFVEGGSLAQKLAGKPLPPRDAVRLVEALARAVHLAHSRNIVHRDLKPANVLLAADGTPKVTDFGLARHLDDDSGMTQPGAVMGTPSYMAPEQALGQAHLAGPAADVYALGAILYECLTGRPPFRGETTLQTLEQVRTQEPVAPRLLEADCPRDLETVCLRCLRKEPERRYASAAELADELGRYQRGEPVLARPVGRLERTARWARRNPALAIAMATAVLFLVGGAATASWQAMRATWAEQQMQVERDRAQLALTSQVAERLEGEVRQLAILGHLIEATLAQPEVRDDAQLKRWLKDLLGKEERIRSLALAFDKPRKLSLEQKDYCLFVWRDRPKGKIQATQLVTGEYEKNPYRNWAWYKRPLEDKCPLWIGPGLDVGDVWTVSYCVPLRRGDDWVGVLTVDLQVDYFLRLWGWLAEGNLGQKSYGFVVCWPGTTDGRGADRTGTFIGHPAYGLPSKTAVLKEADPAIADLARRILDGETGAGTAIDPSTGKRATFLFAPVPSARWTFVAVIEQTGEMAP
jgi:hypothetical protein